MHADFSFKLDWKSTWMEALVATRVCPAREAARCTQPGRRARPKWVNPPGFGKHAFLSRIGIDFISQRALPAPDAHDPTYSDLG